MDEKLSRSEVLKHLIVLPALGAVLAGTASAATPSDNKRQFRYQDHPSTKGQKCSGCRFFRKPNACSIVTGKISPNGWCIAWVKR